MNQEELKQRLIELLEQCSCPYSPPCTGECFECHRVEMYDEEIEHIADHLIANGVTIRERGEWKVNTYCSRCGYFAEDDEGNIVMSFDDFCPSCGADMRGVKDE